MLAVIGWKSVLCFSLHIFRALAASLSALQQKRTQTRLLYLLIRRK